MLPLCTFLAFGFANLAVLGWLAAAAAPLLIHLWSRHRYREAPWAAMQFLFAAIRKNARRMQLQQWLLLALRTLIIALVVLAAAEPHGEKLLARGGAKPAHKVIVLDDSYSMTYRDDGSSRFDRARQLAAAAVRKSGPADTFTVIVMAAPPRTILGSEVVDHAAVATEIETLSPSQTAADLPATLTLVQEALSSRAGDRRMSDRHEVYFFTDLQRSTWENPNAEVEAAISSIAARASLAAVDLGDPRATNSAVTQLAASEPLAMPDREIAFDVTLRQFGDQSRQQCAIEFFVDDVPVGEKTVDLPAGGDAVVRFIHRFATSGYHAVSVRAANDRLSVDDSRFLVVRVREEIRVLCVAGGEGAADYIASALSPDPAGNSPIHPVIVSDEALAELTFTDFDCIFLSNVAQLAPDEAERLRQYVKLGGGIVIFLGDRVLRDNYNELVDSQSSADSLLPALLDELAANARFGLDPLDYLHPIVSPFRGRERAGLLTTPVQRYFRLKVPKSRPDAQIAAAMLNGDPFIVTAPLGRGRTVLVATAATLASIDAHGEPWTSWPTWPSFLPIVRELLAYAAGGADVQLQQRVGAPLGDALPLSKTDPNGLQIVRPDGRTDPVSVQSVDDSPEWTYAATDISGVYLLHGLPNGESRQFAVNIDASESDLAKANLRQLPPQLSLSETWQQPGEDLVTSPQSTAGWAQSLLAIAFALLLVESFLAWLFGRGAL